MNTVYIKKRKIQGENLYERKTPFEEGSYKAPSVAKLIKEEASFINVHPKAHMAKVLTYTEGLWYKVQSFQLGSIVSGSEDQEGENETNFYCAWL